MMPFPRLIIAGTHSGVGKTTVTLAIQAALKARGRQVQAFKVGPDFIDPGHHRVVTGRPSRNLDGWILGEAANRDIFTRAAADADISIIEGMMGLFDGSSPVNDTGSTAELAKRLDAPVLLVIDGSAMARSAAAMVLGYAKFDPALRVTGVLFNRVSSEGHYKLLKEAVEHETDVMVVGYLRPDPALTISDRHLGLVTAMEQGTGELYGRLAKAAEETVDLDYIESLARSAPENVKGKGLGEGGPECATQGSSFPAPGRVRIGVAQDSVFCFYYPENLELLGAEGAELVKFSPMNDRVLPDVDMLYLGGGYPELHGEVLARNVTMRTAIRQFAEQGGTIYAECGGMMYLTQAIRDFAGASHEMVGLFPAEAVMQKSGLVLGYRTVECSQDCILGALGSTARGHEFHYSTLVPKGRLDYACVLCDARGEAKGSDGLIVGNVIALYSHLHFASQRGIAKSLVSSIRGTSSRVPVNSGGAN
ncbi:MAG TPA: cobyrinate a,c-diamide synthase [Nitrospiraceae bacterium]|nr:cobyrinate a,c-diamide synthase [Nitrospiraceae bacterium]